MLVTKNFLSKSDMCVPITVISATANINMELVELNPTPTRGAATEEGGNNLKFAL